jgi:hypothetical protein
MSLEYVIKLSNPTPRHRNMTIRRGRPLSGDRIVCSTDDVSVRVPPYSWMNVLYDDNGTPHPSIVRSIDDIGIGDELPSTGRISFNEERTIRIKVDGVDNDSLTDDRASREKFTEAASKVYSDLHHAPDQYLGGRMVLAQNSFLRSQRDGKPGLYSPAALNLRVDEGTDTLYHMVKAGSLEMLECIGNGYNSDDALQLKVSNNTGERIRFRVPQGMMFEQAGWTGNQNLVVPSDQWYEIGPGEEQSFPVPAMCANATGGSPNRNRMNLTPFLFKDRGGSFRSQHVLWNIADGRRRDTRL